MVGTVGDTLNTGKVSIVDKYTCRWPARGACMRVLSVPSHYMRRRSVVLTAGDDGVGLQTDFEKAKDSEGFGLDNFKNCVFGELSSCCVRVLEVIRHSRK